MTNESFVISTNILNIINKIYTIYELLYKYLYNS